MDGDRVTWRLEILAGWGMRLDPTWLPTDSADSWRGVFEAEDLAGRVFAAGGADLPWTDLARTANSLTSVLGYYRTQWQCAEEVAAACPAAAEAHLAAMAVPAGLRPPRRTHPGGRWRTCALRDGVPVLLAEHADVDLAEGTAVAHRTLAADRACWAEPVDAGPAPGAVGAPGWGPRVATAQRRRAFAAAAAVAPRAAAASTGHTGPDVLSTALLCLLGQAAHHMIREYRTLFRLAWTDLEACVHAAAHDADAEALLAAAPEDPDRGPGGRWHHMELTAGRARKVQRLPSRSAAAWSVAAYRATDEATVRWTEPALRGR